MWFLALWLTACQPNPLGPTHGCITIPVVTSTIVSDHPSFSPFAMLTCQQSARTFAHSWARLHPYWRVASWRCGPAPAEIQDAGT